MNRDCEPPCPAASSLAGLACRPARSWLTGRRDPGLAVLVAAGLPELAEPDAALSPDRLADPELLRLALRGTSAAWVDWSTGPAGRLRHYAVRVAAAAERVAVRAGRDRGTAWLAGFLTPSGWFAFAVSRPDLIDSCLRSEEPIEAVRRVTGQTPQEIGRRCGRRWRLPETLLVTSGHLDLPPDAATGLGGDRRLLATVQLAASLVDGPRLLPRVDAESAAAELGLTPNAVTGLADDLFRRPEPPGSQVHLWQDPRGVPLLHDLLEASLAARGGHAEADVARLEGDIDALHRALTESARDTAVRSRDEKLEALAEFAAGAAHEINNPLSVISGHAQRLLAGEGDPARRDGLAAVVRQAKKIHGLMMDLMRFARPPAAIPTAVPLAGLAEDVAGSLKGFADDGRVTFSVRSEGPPAVAWADAGQCRLALENLARNAVEASPAGGVVRLLVGPGPQVAVEDDGPGPSGEAREHMFDPFFSGRSAGRGRGLGLSTAWRLAGRGGGSVEFEPSPAGPTRFVMRLPAAPARAMTA